MNPKTKHSQVYDLDTQICIHWLTQCFWNFLDWPEICHYVCICALMGADYQVYACLAVLKHLQPLLLRQTQVRRMQVFLKVKKKRLITELLNSWIVITWTLDWEFCFHTIQRNRRHVRKHARRDVAGAVPLSWERVFRALLKGTTTALFQSLPKVHFHHGFVCKQLICWWCTSRVKMIFIKDIEMMMTWIWMKCVAM